MPKVREFGDLAAAGELRCEPQQQLDRQADHVGDVSLDPRDQGRAQSLHRVSAGAPAPLAAREIDVDQLGFELREGHPSGLDPGADREPPLDPVRSEQRQGAKDLVRAAGERLQAPARLAFERRLAKGTTVHDDLGVAGDHQRPPSASRRDRPALRQGVGEHDLTRLPLADLLDLRCDRSEPDSQRFQQRFALRGPGGEDYSSGNQIRISRSADSGESEPCTRLKVTSVPNCPRIEPASASTGSVAPITWRAALTVFGPSSTIATSSPPVMNSTSSPKNGLSVCSSSW